MGLRTPGVPPSAGVPACAISASAVRNRPHRKGERFIQFVLSEVLVFISKPFCSPYRLIMSLPRLNEGKTLSGEALFPGFRPLLSSSFAPNLASVSTSKDQGKQGQHGLREGVPSIVRSICCLNLSNS
jgi:hypothetical protein